MRLSYQDDGAGPVVLLLHGFPLDRSMWEHQRQALRRSYRVIAPDLRGHGQSDSPDGIYPVDEMADDVVELLDTLKISEPIVVGGLSMGGYVALSLAARDLKRLRGLMLLNTRAGADSAETARIREELAQEIDRTGDVGPIIETMLPRLFSASTLKNQPGLVEQIRGVMSRTSAKGVAGTLRGLAVRPDRTADLHRIDIPALVISSQDDALIPLSESKAMAEALPAAELVVIPEAGHLSPIENPTATNAAILRFLGSLA